MRNRGYGQFCPVAKAAEVLAERWTPLVVRELLAGSRRFGELQRGIPLMSPTMLSQRLRELEEAGVIERRPMAKGQGKDSWEYHLTPAGRDLHPLISQLGTWGKRWALKELRREDLDPAFLMWALHRHIRIAALGTRRVVIAFTLIDAPANKRHWWLVVNESGDVDVCLKHPGYSVDVTASGSVRAFAQVLLGTLEPRNAIQVGAIRLEGEAQLVRGFCDWCPRSPFAQVKAAGEKVEDWKLMGRRTGPAARRQT